MKTAAHRSRGRIARSGYTSAHAALLHCSAPDAPPLLDPWGGEHGHICESCAEREWERAQERAMEGPSRPRYPRKGEEFEPR